MQIYFDEIDPEILDEMGGSAFKYNDKFYEYRITVEADNVLLEDSVGRNVPFAHESIENLYRALGSIKGISNTLAQALEVMDALEENRVIYFS
jgi:hypothetical protein